MVFYLPTISFFVTSINTKIKILRKHVFKWANNNGISLRFNNYTTIMTKPLNFGSFQFFKLSKNTLHNLILLVKLLILSLLIKIIFDIFNHRLTLVCYY